MKQKSNACLGMILAFLCTATHFVHAEPEGDRIKVGDMVGDAVDVLKRHGIDDSQVLEMQKLPNEGHLCFEIDQSMFLLIGFVESTKTISHLSLISSPRPSTPKIHRRHSVIRSLAFEPDGSYFVHMERKHKRLKNR